MRLSDTALRPIRRLPLLAAFLSLTTLFLVAGEGLADVPVVVKGGATDVEMAPVMAPIPPSLAGKPVQLVDAKSGKVIASQRDLRHKKEYVVWILDSLPAGETREFTLKEGSSETPAPGEGVELTENKAGGVDVKINGKLFTSYRVDGSRPSLWPIIGPTGKPVTRAYPLDDSVAGEDKDHPWHRSLWFGHRGVNGVNFWEEGKETSGVTKHVRYGKLASGPVFGRLVAYVDWVAPDGKLVMQDLRFYTFYNVPDARLIDFRIILSALDEEVKFSDDKDGTFGIRVAQTMNLKQKKGSDAKPGKITTSEGKTDKEAWGTAAAWCDYTGLVDGKEVGIAVMESPQNVGFPHRWHVRDYGLFAANPFGTKTFTEGGHGEGTVSIPAKGKLQFKYRLYIHGGDAQTADVAAVFAGFEHPPKVIEKK